MELKVALAQMGIRMGQPDQNEATARTMAAEAAAHGSELLMLPELWPTGSGLRRVSRLGGWPVWWPDGSRIGYLSVGPDGNQRIHTLALAEEREEVLEQLVFAGTNCPFDVSRDGTLLVSSNSRQISSDIWLLEPAR